MNVKKILTILLAVFLLTAVCCGTVSAFSYNKEATVSPSGSLVPGQKVTAAMDIKFPEKSVKDSSRVIFTTPLVAESWDVSIYRYDEDTESESFVMTKHPSDDTGNAISGFDFRYDSAVILKIRLEGTVASQSSGSSISVLNIEAKGMSDGGHQTYSSLPQKIYNPGELSSELANLKQDIESLNKRIAYYQGYGYDVSNAQSLTDQATSKYNAALNAGSAGTAAAFENLEGGDKCVGEAQVALAFTSLTMSLSNMAVVDTDIETLRSKGWNNEAVLLDSKNTLNRGTYNQLLSTYKTAPNAVELDKLAASTLDLHEEALTYIEKANNPLGGLLGVLPFILIGVGVVVVGVVAFLLIRRRKNSWDELG